MSKPYSITKQGTVVNDVVTLLYCVLLVIIFGGITNALATIHFHHTYTFSIRWLLLGLGGIGVVIASMRLHSKRLLARHNLAIEAYTPKDSLPPEIMLSESRLFDLSSLRNIRNARDIKLTNYVAGDDWSYAEQSYKIYRHTKYGDYQGYTVYYSVMVTRLPRSLPNVFFDSKQARGRQFRFHFGRSQLHRLEGDFDSYFATYFPEQYTIDSMSFISPDVMLALREAAAYDIEIAGAELYIYGSLCDPSTQLPDMSTKLRAIKQQLLDNILTYRDERLPYDQGRQRVTPLAMNLKRSTFWTYVSIAGATAYFLFWLAVQVFAK